MLYFAPHVSSTLIDEPITATLHGVGLGEAVDIRVSARDHDHRLWSQTFQIHIDGSRAIDLVHASQADDDLPFDPHALVHQLAPETPTRWTNQISSTLRPLTVSIEALDPATDRLLASTEHIRAFSRPDVSRHEWRTRQTIANLYKPAQSHDPRAVIVLPGAWGGFDWCNQMAALIAARGRPALALPYFDWRGEYGLPTGIAHIPLEYAQRAARRLHEEPGIDPHWISVIGMSKGAEFALAWASHDRRVNEVIALSPTLYAWESVREDGTPPARSSWTYAGRPLPFLHFDADAEFYETLDKTLLQKFHERAVAAAPDGSPARLPVEDITARTLLISQESDTLWPASSMGTQIAQAMDRARKGAQVEHVIAPGRGHAMFAAGVPANGVDASPRVNGLAQTEIWSHVRRFLQL
ncbi:acyl-CoA thioester hydrolase/BAAT C-terminal domain-containing protein [Oerskovia jenensis]|uniref:Dienelactone hydrolase n=1 Tax=Oerskovia jenensis TaxID=162169 RepID=A0ABS2LKG3_9CELL|nr:acyl-CoA thioester hydrolase/BAAT C-terminal domain-containing protein [Oerskovia jenensis]MBM7480924.1 dienelactone hydrolase [Oerskovia jenensis]